ncbi:MAG: cytochrome c3 family protein [Gemmatimonadota bacterium]
MLAKSGLRCLQADTNVDVVATLRAIGAGGEEDCPMKGEQLRPAVFILLIVAAGLSIGLAACTDEEVVFRERPLFEDPPAGAAGFLGYTDQEAKLTVCGNCHIGMQSGWETTGHADAWAGLQESGHAQEFCEGCHTVNELGNATEEAGGWPATGNPRYQDVQCESCHGPGSTHIENPDGEKPLASIAAGVDLDNGCGECHSGTHHPFVDQWAQSAHGNVTAFAAGRDGCNACHDGERAMSAKFGESSDFIEKNDGEFEQIVCATCHDPHGSGNTANLRAPLEASAGLSNLCVTCHARQGTPPSSRGPHAAQGFLVLGENAGWIPPSFEYDTARIVSTHGTAANDRLCATCHVDSFEVTDAETGEFQFQAVGHTFDAIPCLDSEGLPVAGGECAVSERKFSACTGSGCHGTAEAARSAFVTTRGRINSLLDELWVDSDEDNVIDASDQGLLPQVVAQGDPSELDVSDNTTTVAEGALWNAQLAHTRQRTRFGDGEAFGVSFSAHKSSGEGVHNPFLLEALLTASIRAMEEEYGLSASIDDPSVQAELPPTVSGSR